MNKTAKENTTKSSVIRKVGAGDILGSAPGILMCLLTFMMLIADAVATDPQKQYELYPLLFRYINYGIVLAGGALFCLQAVDPEWKGNMLRRMKNDRTWAFFAVFLLLMVLSTCVNGLTYEAVHGIPFRYIGVFHMAAFILIYMGASAFISSDKIRMLVLVLYTVIADLTAVSVLYDLYISEIPAYHAKKELSAVFFNGNHYGYYLVMAILIGLGMMLYMKGWQAVLGAATFAVNLVLLMINHSLGCILAAGIVTCLALIIILITQPELRKRAGIVAGVLVLAAIAGINMFPAVKEEFDVLFEDIGNILSGSTSGKEGHNRLALWELTWSYIKEKPLLGSGCEGIALRMYSETGRSDPHCEVLTYAAYYGIPAAIAYLAGVLSVLIRSLRNWRGYDAASKAACFAASGYFISSLTGVGMFYTLPFFFILLGMQSSSDKR